MNCSYAIAFFQFGHHNDRWNTLFPNHSPKIAKCLRQRTLSSSPTSTDQRHNEFKRDNQQNVTQLLCSACCCCCCCCRSHALWLLHFWKSGGHNTREYIRCSESDRKSSVNRTFHVINKQFQSHTKVISKSIFSSISATC